MKKQRFPHGVHLTLFLLLLIGGVVFLTYSLLHKAFPNIFRGIDGWYSDTLLTQDIRMTPEEASRTERSYAEIKIDTTSAHKIDKTNNIKLVALHYHYCQPGTVNNCRYLNLIVSPVDNPQGITTVVVPDMDKYQLYSAYIGIKGVGSDDQGYRTHLRFISSTSHNVSAMHIEDELKKGSLSRSGETITVCGGLIGDVCDLNIHVTVTFNAQHSGFFGRSNPQIAHQRQ